MWEYRVQVFEDDVYIQVIKAFSVLVRQLLLIKYCLWDVVSSLIRSIRSSLPADVREVHLTYLLFFVRLRLIFISLDDLDFISILLEIMYNLELLDALDSKVKVLCRWIMPRDVHEHMNRWVVFKPLGQLFVLVEEYIFAWETITALSAYSWILLLSWHQQHLAFFCICLLYTSPSPRD